jgi:hypothetical protein
MLDEAERAVATEQLKHFVEQFGAMQILSTGARAVDYAGELYNVEGSTPDPHIDGRNWKRLLQAHGISGNCFADTPQAPDGSSHPGFSVGGHVTPDPGGRVAIGGICYLMPLCYWHNGKANDGKPFEHQQTRILELSGYMQGEPAATYLARMSTEAPLALIFLGDEGLSYRNIGEDSASLEKTIEMAAPIEGAGATGAQRFVLLRRNFDGEAATYTVADARL